MALHTIPELFPQFSEHQAYSRKVISSALMRRLAQAQNYIWSRMIRIYGNHGYEGNGNELFHLGTYPIDPAIGHDGAGMDGQSAVEIAADGRPGIRVCTFVVPVSFCASRRMQIIGQYVFTTTSGEPPDVLHGTNGAIIAGLYGLDDKLLWAHTSTNPIRTSSADPQEFTLEMEVPPTGEYECRIHIFLDDVSTDVVLGPDKTVALLKLESVTARYAIANAAEVGGDAVQPAWRYMADFMRDNYPIFSAAFIYLIRNIIHIWATRGPTIANIWLSPPQNNTSTFVRVGCYYFWTSSPSYAMQCAIKMWCTNGGAGNEVRLDVNGVTVETATAIAFGASDYVFAEFGIAEDGLDTPIKIELFAKSTSDGSTWGTIVNSVSIWETQAPDLPHSEAYPDDYDPLDENALEGDDPITADDTNFLSQAAGLRKLFANDKWLVANRLKCIAGDWRHRTYKRGPLFSSPADFQFDTRTDWTPGTPEVQYQVGRPKNLTIRASDNDNTDTTPLLDDSLGGYAGGAFGYPASIGTYTESPYTYPADLQYDIMGCRLGFYPIYVPPSANAHSLDINSNLVVRTRARRLRPATLGSDVSGLGPLAEEVPFLGGAYLTVGYDYLVSGPHAAISYRVPITDIPSAHDWELKWLPPQYVQQQGLGGDFFVELLGRCPKRATPGVPAPGRPEGMLFEVELASVYIADEPLSKGTLDAL